MKTMNRKEWLQQLELVQPGLSTKELIEQSTCFVFEKGFVKTFNDEIACTLACDIGIEGAVQAKPLLELLKKLPEETVEVQLGDKQLLIQGEHRKAGIRMESEVFLDTEQIETPKEDAWIPLPPDFCEAVEVVRQTASQNDSEFVLTCVHIHPEYVEACNNYQATRFPLKMKVSSSILVRHTSMLHVGSLGIMDFAEDSSWLHFRNPMGLVISCRKYEDEFPDMGEILNVSGDPITLPSDIEGAASTAQIFSMDNPYDDQIQITISRNKLRLKGTGENGWYSETKKLEYDGPKIQFRIAPKLLKEITKRQHDCEITRDRLKIDGGTFIYVTALNT